MTATPPPHRRAILELARGLACGAALTVGFRSQGSAQIAPNALVLQLDSAPGAEHGGLYAAQSAGFFRQAGLEIEFRRGEIRPGAARKTPVEALQAGADMVLCQAAELAILAAQGQPIRAIAAFFQKTPRAIFCHPGQGLDDLAKLKGRPLLLGAQSRAAIWPYLRAKFGFADDQLRPYGGDIGPFLADKRMCLEGSITEEQIGVERDGGIRPLVYRLSETGLDPYDEVLAISPSMPVERQALVQAFLDAAIAGWTAYLAPGPEAGAAHAFIRTQNPELSEERLAAARAALVERALLTSGDTAKAGIGAMSEQRWKALAEELVATSLIRPDFDIAGAYTLAFLHKRTAP